MLCLTKLYKLVDICFKHTNLVIYSNKTNQISALESSICVILISQMGGWKLEVFKMALYISFPVGLFYIFNQPQYFDKWVIKNRQQLYPPENEESRREFRQEIGTRRRALAEKELLQKLDNLKWYLCIQEIFTMFRYL